MEVPSWWSIEIEKITQQQEAEFDEVLPSRFGNPIDDGNVTLEKKYDVSITTGKGNGRGSNGNARQQHHWCNHIVVPLIIHISKYSITYIIIMLRVFTSSIRHPIT